MSNVQDGCHPLAFHSRKTTNRYLDKRRPIQKRFVGFKDLCADWTSCKAGQLVMVSYCFVLFLHDLTSKVMPWQLLLLGMFPIIKAGCGPCRGNLDFSWVCSKPAHPHSFRSCTPFACTCQEEKHAFPYCLHTILLHKQKDYQGPSYHFGIHVYQKTFKDFSFERNMEFI